MFDYYQKILKLEDNMLNTDFKTDFCNELINVLKDCLEYKKLSAKFETNDPLKSLVFEIYTTFENFYHKNIIDLHSIHYPYLYMLDMEKDYKIFKNLSEKKYELNLEKAVEKSLNNKFEGLYSMVNKKSFEEMLPFDENLDYTQASESDHINMNISEEMLKNRGQKFIFSLIGVIYNAALEHVKIKQTKELHDLLKKENEEEKMSVVLNNYLSDRFDLQDTSKILDLISSSEPFYFNKHQIKNKIKP